MAGLASSGVAGSPPGPKASSGRPLRFLAVYTPHGRAHELWQPRQGFDLCYADAILQPFDDPASHGRSFKDKLLVLDGIDLSAGIAVGTVGHDGPRVILTGSGADGKNASIDQFLAIDHGLGAETPHSSIALGVGNDQSVIGANISYAAGGTPIPKWIDPSQTFSELFGTPLSGAERTLLEQQRSAGKSVLDVVRSDLARLEARAPQSERVKLEQHQSALREIEKRLTPHESTCPAPPRPDASKFPKLRAYGGGEPYFDAMTDLQIDLVGRAFACDLSRFATLFLADLSRSHLYPELPPDIHTDVAHRYDALTDKHAGTPSTWHALAIQNRYGYGKVARLLRRLDEAGVLDDTIVYVSGDMGDPARHSSRSVPTLLAGGCGGHFKMGRYLDLRRDASGVPNNRILVSICQAFGVTTNRFGHATDAGVTTGRLEELYG
jgi:Protein of unknown function (DUF1552)